MYDAFHVTADILNCSNENAVLATKWAMIATGIILRLTFLIGMLGLYYRYEIFILKSSFSKNWTNNEHKFHFDVFLSFSPNSSFVSKLNMKPHHL